MISRSLAFLSGDGYNVMKLCLKPVVRSYFKMIERLFWGKFLHLLPEFSCQIATSIFPESLPEPEVYPLNHSDDNFKIMDEVKYTDICLKCLNEY